MDDTVQIVEKNPAKFKIDASELAVRKAFIQQTRDEVNLMKARAENPGNFSAGTRAMDVSTFKSEPRETTVLCILLHFPAFNGHYPIGQPFHTITVSGCSGSSFHQRNASLVFKSWHRWHPAQQPEERYRRVCAWQSWSHKVQQASQLPLA